MDESLLKRGYILKYFFFKRVDILSKFFYKRFVIILKRKSLSLKNSSLRNIYKKVYLFNIILDDIKKRRIKRIGVTNSIFFNKFMFNKLRELKIAIEAERLRRRLKFNYFKYNSTAGEFKKKNLFYVSSLSIFQNQKRGKFKFIDYFLFYLYFFGSKISHRYFFKKRLQDLVYRGLLKKTNNVPDRSFISQDNNKYLYSKNKRFFFERNKKNYNNNYNKDYKKNYNNNYIKKDNNYNKDFINNK